jgi:hypothetical protein
MSKNGPGGFDYGLSARPGDSPVDSCRAGDVLVPQGVDHVLGEDRRAMAKQQRGQHRTLLCRAHVQCAHQAQNQPPAAQRTRSGPRTAILLN